MGWPSSRHGQDVSGGGRGGPRHGPRAHAALARQEVGLWLLFVPPRVRRCREVVVRTLSDDGWSDLETRLEEEAPKVRAITQACLSRRPGAALPNTVPSDPVPRAQRLWAHCQVPHFSWFLVVSRPVSNACLVPPEGTLLFSSGNPGIKVTFPPGATEEPRHVCMQVLAGQPPRVAGGALAQASVQVACLPQVVHMADRELQALLGEPTAAVSPLLCLSQSGPSGFLRPVTVQLPLPPGITGERWPRGRAGPVAVGWGQCSEGQPLPLGAQPAAPSCLQASVWTAPACTCCTRPLPQPPGMTSRPRWHWSSPTCMLASRSCTSPGQCPLWLLRSPPCPPRACSPSSPQPSQVLALVHHQDLCRRPGAEGLGAAAAAPREPHRTAEAAGPRAGPAAVPAPPQGAAWAGGARAGAAGWGWPALGSEPRGAPRWTPPCGGCWSGTTAPSPPTRWRCSRVRSSLPPLRGAWTWMPVRPSPWSGGLGSAPGPPAEHWPCPQTAQTAWRAGCASSSTHT